MLARCLAIIFFVLAGPSIAAEWHYTDGAGKQVTLAEPPQRIIAHSTVAAALIPLGIIPVGIFRDGPPSLDRSLEGIDIGNIPIVSHGWFEIDAEAILALDPDIIITEYSTIERTYDGGTHEGAAITARLESIAPIIGIARGPSIEAIIETYYAFAETLGADIETPALLADRAAFDAAVANFKRAVAAKPGLTVMAVSPFNTGLSIASPPYFGELSDFVGWGLKMITPKVAPGTSYETLSWELADTYKPDVLLLDDRWENSSYEIITNHPLAKRLPAVVANQLGDWPADWIRSYRVYAQELDQLSALIARSHVVAGN